jgi:hypothetical protein
MKCRICDAYSAWYDASTRRYGIGDQRGVTVVFPEDVGRPLHARSHAWVCQACAIAVAVEVERSRDALGERFRRALDPPE